MKDNVEIDSEDVENNENILNGYISWNIWLMVVIFSKYQKGVHK